MYFDLLMFISQFNRYLFLINIYNKFCLFISLFENNLALTQVTNYIKKYNSNINDIHIYFFHLMIQFDYFYNICQYFMSVICFMLYIVFLSKFFYRIMAKLVASFETKEYD